MQSVFLALAASGGAAIVSLVSVVFGYLAARKTSKTPAKEIDVTLSGKQFRVELDPSNPDLAISRIRELLETVEGGATGPDGSSGAVARGDGPVVIDGVTLGMKQLDGAKKNALDERRNGEAS